MDAGVLQLHVLPHEAAPYRPMMLGEGERIVPTLTPGAPIERSGAVSLIIPTFLNRSQKNGSLGYLLDGLERSSTVDEVVLVVADGQGDGEEPFPSASGKRLIRVACEPNKRARSRNIGVAAASHPILLFLDDDMLLRDWNVIDVLVSRLLTSDYDCALFPRRNYARFPLLYDRAGLERIIARWCAGADCVGDPAFLDPVVQGSPYKTMAFCFPGCFMLIRREAYRRIGGFPEEFEGWGFEDAAFAMRAITRLRVLNLFRKSDPLLHIDHPVTPYKSEEYRANFDKFSATYNTMDMDWLCRRVAAGEDFHGGDGDPDAKATYLGPLREVAEAYRLPFPTDEVERNYEHVVRKRLEQGFDPLPEQIVLHGSRGGGRSAPDSDFDLLFLFRGGALTEYFVCQGDGGARVELEFANFANFEYIAAKPAFFLLRGPLELAKLTRGLVLWGDEDRWRDWVDQLLRTALGQGRIVWLLFGLGMLLRPEKLGDLRHEFWSALRSLLARADAAGNRAEIRLLAEPRPETLAAHVRSLLDAELPCWRADMAAGCRVFAFQVPEVWMALQWIMRNA